MDLLISTKALKKAPNVLSIAGPMTLEVMIIDKHDGIAFPGTIQMKMSLPHALM